MFKNSVKNAKDDRRCAIACAILVIFIGVHFHWYAYYIVSWIFVILPVYRFWRLAIVLPIIFVKKIRQQNYEKMAQYALQYTFGEKEPFEKEV